MEASCLGDSKPRPKWQEGSGDAFSQEDERKEEGRERVIGRSGRGGGVEEGEGGGRERDRKERERGGGREREGRRERERERRKKRELQKDSAPRKDLLNYSPASRAVQGLF